MITQHELGRRLKIAREAANLTQAHVAQQMDLSRVTVSQIEGGKRPVSTIELVNLAHLYGRDITSFLSDQSAERDALATLFRANPDLTENETVREQLRDAAERYREYNNLKHLLELEDEQPAPPAYPCGDPRSVWDAIQMGEWAAGEERSRLDLGADPIRDMSDVAESQGIPVIEADLADQISGIFMADEEMSPCIFINRGHIFFAKARAAFTIAHEYGHVLLDREKISTISKTTNSRDLLEVRANAFAAAFLMPEEGLRQFLRNIGKGETSRERLLVYAEQDEPIVGHHRRLASSQVITLYDVAQLHTYFGTSFEAALYRLKNLKLISDEAFDELFQRKEETSQISAHLRMADEDKEQRFSKFNLNFLGMAIEAYRREQITYAKLLKLSVMVGFDEDTVDQVLRLMGIEESSENEAYFPE